MKSRIEEELDEELRLNRKIRVVKNWGKKSKFYEHTKSSATKSKQVIPVISLKKRAKNSLKSHSLSMKKSPARWPQPSPWLNPTPRMGPWLRRKIKVMRDDNSAHNLIKNIESSITKINNSTPVWEFQLDADLNVKKDTLHLTPEEKRMIKTPEDIELI